jgi:hypothetical protein
MHSRSFHIFLKSQIITWRKLKNYSNWEKHWHIKRTRLLDFWTCERLRNNVDPRIQFLRHIWKYRKERRAIEICFSLYFECINRQFIKNIWAIFPSLFRPPNSILLRKHRIITNIGNPNRKSIIIHITRLVCLIYQLTESLCSYPSFWNP